MIQSGRRIRRIGTSMLVKGQPALDSEVWAALAGGVGGHAGGASSRAGREVRATARARGGRELRERNRTNRSFSTNQWQWWVIYPNSTKFGSGGVPPQLLHENRGVGASSTVFWSRSTVELLELVVFG
jgi:hypothetical protein